MAVNCLVEVARSADRDINLLIEGMLVEQLRYFRTNPKELNGVLVQTLMNAGSEMADPLINEALASGNVDESYLEDWDDAAVDHDHDSHDHEHDESASQCREAAGKMTLPGKKPNASRLRNRAR
jgi:hypothetical protein